MRGSIIIGAAALLAALSGCLEIEETITIGADGSGTQSMRMSMPREMLARMQKQAVAGRAVDQKQVDLTAIFKRKIAAAEFASAGLEMRKHAVTERRSSKTLDIEVGFSDLAGLGRSPLGGGKADWIVRDGGKGKTALFFYPMGKQAWKDAKVRIKEFGKQPVPRQQAFFRKQKMAMQGLRLQVTINLPGRVLRKSANLKIGARPTQVVASVTAADIRTPVDLLRLLGTCCWVEFDGRQCSIGKGDTGRKKVAKGGR